MTTSQANPATFGAGDNRSPIEVVGPDRRREAIDRLLAGDGQADPDHTRRFLDYAAQHAVSLEHLWGWVDSRGRYLAVALAVPGAGRSAMLFASQASSLLDQSRLGQILEFGARQLNRAGVHLAQTLLDPHDQAAQEAFLAGGFQRLATLSYLERPLRSRLLPAAPEWPADASVTCYDEKNRRELVELLDATYEKTLDCPGLRGHRSTSDILDGHRASGHFDPELWSILRLDGQAAGAILLNPASDKSSIELVYLGLAMPARGRGLGTHLLRHGLHSVAHRPERVMTLAVDDANWPALRLYGRENFRPVLRRCAMIRPLRTHADSRAAD